MYYATYQGLHHWHKHMFENLGWMILAKKHGYRTKVKAYLESIVHLEKAIGEKIRMVQEEDRKLDLSILQHNVAILKKEAYKILR